MMMSLHNNNNNNNNNSTNSHHYHHHSDHHHHHSSDVVDVDRPLYQFVVTKLRSWRTGYIRIFALYKDHFVTYDPTVTSSSSSSSSNTANSSKKDYFSTSHNNNNNNNNNNMSDSMRIDDSFGNHTTGSSSNSTGSTTTTTTTTNTTTNNNSQSTTTMFTMKETNRWQYTQLIECMTVPNERDTILLQVQSVVAPSLITTTTTTTTTTTHNNNNNNNITHGSVAGTVSVPHETLKFSCSNNNNNNNNNNNSSPTTTGTATATTTTTTTTNHPNVIVSVRSILLTLLLRQQYIATTTTTLSSSSSSVYPIFHSVQKYSNLHHSQLRQPQSQSQQSIQVTLQILPFGIIEHYNNDTTMTTTTTITGSSFQQQQQTFLFIDMIGISIASSSSSEEEGMIIIIHFREMNHQHIYRIVPSSSSSSSNRTHLYQLIQDHCSNLGLYFFHHHHHPQSSQQQQQQYGLPTRMIPPQFNITTTTTTTSIVGPIVLCWNVTKIIPYRRGTTHSNTSSSSSSSTITVRRQLAITGFGYIVETEYNDHDTSRNGNSSNGNSSSIRRLNDLYCIHRDRENASLFTLEYIDCTTIVSYMVVASSSSSTTNNPMSTTMMNRDAVIVSIYDTATIQFNNPILHISDLSSSSSSFRYCLVLPPHPSTTTDGSCHDPSSSMNNRDDISLAASTTKGIANLFQSTSVQQYILKRLYTISTYIYALITGDFALPQQSEAHQRQHQNYIKNLSNQIECYRTLIDACYEFNCSIQQPYIDFINPTSTVEKQMIGTIGSLFGIIAALLQYKKHSNSLDSDTVTTPQPHPDIVPDIKRQLRNEQMVGTMFQTIYRLVQTPVGYKCSSELTTLRECLPYLWSIDDTYCKYSAYSVLNVLLSGFHQKNRKQPLKRDMESEYVNKNVILKCGGTAMIDGLVTSLLPIEGEYNNNDAVATQQTQLQQHHIPSDLILMVTSDILQSLLCSYYDTTSAEHFQLLIGALANRHRALLSLLRSSTPFVLENTALLLHLLSSHAPSSTTAIRDVALSSAIVLQHLYAATYSPLEGQRFLSRYLCSLWFAGPTNCDEKRLLKRIVPHGFLAYLNMPPLSRMEEDQLDELERDVIEGNITDQGAAAAAALAASTSMISDNQTTAVGAGGTNTARLRSRMVLATNMSVHMGQPISNENFRVFFHVLTQDHNMADLIWNQQTRREFRIALESELEYIRRETEARGTNAIAWNHQQFHVKYPSLDNEVKVGDVYMRLWLQAGDGFIRSWDEPVRLFEHLFRRFLCEVDRDETVTVMCIRCLERLYAIHAVTIGPFTDVLILVRSMISTRSVETQHRLLGLLATLLGVSGDDRDERYGVADITENAEQLLNLDSISQLCQFVAWGHTNSVQVGNILSRALGVGVTNMLTDGTSSSLQGVSDGNASVPNVAADSTCPSIWFVTSSSRVPPPPESIRGPFRLSDLKQLMADDNISHYDFVTTSHVDEYDTDSENSSGSVLEQHIDTGKWKRLNQVWQLRWQLCTDESSSAIYSPSEVAIIALKALSRLVDLHRSLDLRGVAYFPIPIAKRILCSNSRDRNFTSDSNESIPSPFPIICQSLLCNDNQIVDRASLLICKLCEHNDRAVAKLYLTGSFFFALCYTGSNFKMLSKLLHATHLRQHFKSGFAAAANESELPLKDRSILGSMIPEGLLFLLTNYGYERFAEVFVSNADTPEAIWTRDMRKHLIEMIKQHLGDFPLRLFQNTTTEYEYCPMPGVAYKRLEKEIFCHNYYLQNLCDEARFPDWPICEPVEVFRSCLEHFKKQVNRDESAEEESLEKARRILDLKTGDGSKELRKSYRALARQFHPDKNPAGRDMFEAIQNAYEILLPLVERGETIRMFVEESILTTNLNAAESSNSIFPSGQSQTQTMSLLIQTQAMICRRYEKEMSRLQYPAYPILVLCISLPNNTQTDISEIDFDFSKADRATFVLLAVELIFRTCLISPLNSEELVAANGVIALVSLLDFYITVIRTIKGCGHVSRKDGTKLVEEEAIYGITVYITRTLAGVAFYETGRNAIKSLVDRPKFLVNWRRCIDEQTFRSRYGIESSIKRYALEGVANMSKDPVLQEELIGSGLIWPMIQCTMMFDSTLEESLTDHSDFDDVGISVSSINLFARLSIRGLGVLSGLYGDGPKHAGLIDLLNALLTVPIAKMLRNSRTDSILKILNSNVERPDIIWNVEMRKQLESFISKKQEQRPESSCRTTSEEFGDSKEFAYDLLKHELKIGNIFVSYFNRGGKESLAYVESPRIFLESTLNVLALTLNHSMPNATWIEIDVDQKQMGVEMQVTVLLADNDILAVMNTLRILCLTEGLLDEALLQNSGNITSVLLSLLELPEKSEFYTIGSDILLTICSQHNFADAVTKERSLWRLMDVLERSDLREEEEEEETRDKSKYGSILAATGTERTNRGWAVLEGLSSSPSIVNYILSTPVWVELLGVLVGYSKFTKSWSARMGAAKTLSRHLWDPNLGSLADSLIRRMLPSTLTIRLKEDPDDMLKSFDRDVDTPELIWDASMRNELRIVLGSHIDSILLMRRNENRHHDGQIQQNLFVKYSRLDDEVYIGGVYVARFVKEPTYNLRDPTSFLEQLLQRWAKEIETFTLHKRISENTADTAVVTSALPDILDIVTTAIVFICKIHDSLCDKVAAWGYMGRSVAFLDALLSRNTTGAPLLAVIRLLHVCSGRLPNVEALALIGNSDGSQGVVEFVIKAINKDSLHHDSAFMVEFLKKAYITALGDIDKTGSQQHAHTAIRPSFIAMAPSPASGDGPVRKKVSVGDDPLGMMQAEHPNQEETATLQGGGVTAYVSSQPFPVNLVSTVSTGSAAFAGNINLSQGYPSQSLSYQQQAQVSQTQLPPARTPYESRTTAATPVTNQLNNSMSSNTVYQRQLLSSSFAQSNSGPQVRIQPIRQQEYPQSLPSIQQQPQPSFAVPIAHPNSMLPTFQQQQQAQHQHYSREQQQPQNISMMQPGQQRPVQQQYASTPQYNQSISTQTSPQNFYQQQQSPQPHQQYYISSQQPQTMQSPSTSNEQSRRHPLLQQSYNVTQHQQQHQQPQYNISSQQQQQHQQQQPQYNISSQQQQTMQPSFPSNIPPERHQPLQQTYNVTQQQQPDQRLQDNVHQTPNTNQNHAGSTPIVGGDLLPVRSSHDVLQQPIGSHGVHNNQLPPNNYALPTEMMYNGTTMDNTTMTAPLSSDYMGWQQQQQQQQSPMGSHHRDGQHGMISSQPPSYKPTPTMEGLSIIDARSSLDPTIIAAQQTMNVSGAPNSAHGRILWLRQAIGTNLCSFLINNVLENITLQQIRDPQSAKVHAIDLIKLLLQDPGYGYQFQLTLNDIPAWKKYKSQDHSLLITGHEQRADYFLTDGGSSGLEKRLLTDR